MLLTEHAYGTVDERYGGVGWSEMEGLLQHESIEVEKQRQTHQ